MSTARTKKVARRLRRPRIGPGSAGMVMSPEEFDARPAWHWDDRYRYELINGVLIVTPPVNDAEADPNDDLGYLLRVYRESHPNGSALDATMPERTVPTTEQRRRCDRSVLEVGLGRVPRHTCGCTRHRRRIRLPVASRRPPRLRAEARRIPRRRGPGILDHRPVPSYHDGVPPGNIRTDSRNRP